MNMTKIPAWTPAGTIEIDAPADDERTKIEALKRDKSKATTIEERMAVIEKYLGV
jgi:hypothetical protein